MKYMINVILYFKIAMFIAISSRYNRTIIIDMVKDVICLELQ